MLRAIAIALLLLFTVSNAGFAALPVKTGAKTRTVKMTKTSKVQKGEKMMKSAEKGKKMEAAKTVEQPKKRSFIHRVLSRIKRFFVGGHKKVENPEKTPEKGAKK